MSKPVLIVHTTEGTTTASAIETMRRNRSQCHEVVNPATAEPPVQLISWHLPARSLAHPPGTPQTNNRGFTNATAHLGKVYQIEVVGFSRKVLADDYTPEWWEWLAIYLTDRCQMLGVPIEFPYSFGGPEGYGTKGKYRISWDDWATAKGILGHCHVPANTHWDPSDIATPLRRHMTVGEPMAEITLPANRAATIRRIQAALGVEVDGDPYTKTAVAAEAQADIRGALSDAVANLKTQVDKLEAEAATLEREVDKLEGALEGWQSFRAWVRKAIQE